MVRTIHVLWINIVYLTLAVHAVGPLRHRRRRHADEDTDTLATKEATDPCDNNPCAALPVLATGTYTCVPLEHHCNHKHACVAQFICKCPTDGYIAIGSGPFYTGHREYCQRLCTGPHEVTRGDTCACETGFSRQPGNSSTPCAPPGCGDGAHPVWGDTSYCECDDDHEPITGFSALDHTSKIGCRPRPQPSTPPVPQNNTQCPEGLTGLQIPLILNHTPETCMSACHKNTLVQGDMYCCQYLIRRLGNTPRCNLLLYQPGTTESGDAPNVCEVQNNTSPDILALSSACFTRIEKSV
jgi:hypothetical protein